MTTPNRPVLLTADGYTTDRKWRLVPVEMTPEHRIDTINREDFGLTMRSDYAEAIAAAPSPDPAVFNHPDCGQCANRGHVNGLSQESYCSHCIHSEKWRKDYFVRDGSEVTK